MDYGMVASCKRLSSPRTEKEEKGKQPRISER